MTVSLSFSGITTAEVRKLVVAHRRATGGGFYDGRPRANGVKPRIGIEGPEAWSLDTEKLSPEQMLAFQQYAAEYPELQHLFPAVKYGLHPFVFGSAT